MSSVFQRLKQRKLVQWALAYATAAWVTYEVLLAIGDVFTWPTSILRVITVLLGVGFVVVLVDIVLFGLLVLFSSSVGTTVRRGGRGSGPPRLSC